MILRHVTVRYCGTGVDYQSNGYAGTIELDGCSVEEATQDGVYIYATGGAKLALTVAAARSATRGVTGCTRMRMGATARSTPR